MHCNIYTALFSYLFPRFLRFSCKLATFIPSKKNTVARCVCSSLPDQLQPLLHVHLQPIKRLLRHQNSPSSSPWNFYTKKRDYRFFKGSKCWNKTVDKEIVSLWSISINLWSHTHCPIYFTYLDFPEIRGFPFLSYLLGAQNSREVAIIWPDLIIAHFAFWINEVGCTLDALAQNRHCLRFQIQRYNNLIVYIIMNHG